MAISSMIVQPASGSVNVVARELSAIDGVAVHAITPKQEIIIVVEADSLDAIDTVAQTIEATVGVLGVFPAYITTADQEDIS